jgi:hypothetical protein
METILFIFFISKIDKDNVRPISLAVCLLKIMEKMINMRLSWWLEHNHVPPPLQFGLHKNKSCLDNATIVNAFDMNRNLGAIFIDIKSAFDNVLANIINRLKTINLPRKLLVFICNLISGRFLSFRFDMVDVTRMVSQGLP